MKETIYNFMFNPNHEMPSPKVMLVLVGIVIITAIAREIISRRK